MNDIEECLTHGYILAGGKSSRMGIDKGLMLLNGKAIVQYVIDQMQPVVGKLVIVSNNQEYSKFGFEVINDLIHDIGPAGGIYSALNHSTTEKNFIISCDMPFVNSDAIRFVVKNAFQSEITIPLHHQNVEPLFGVYSKTCLPKWEELIGNGMLKMHDLIEYFNVLKLDVGINDLFAGNIFMNINTNSDFEKAIHRN